MRFSFAVLAGALTTSLAVTACGIDDTFDGAVYGPGGAETDGGGKTAPPDGGGTTTPDGGVTVDPDAGPVEAGPPPPPAPCSVAPGACVAALPKGWSLVTYQASQAIDCASPFTKTDVVTNPVANANACGCDCTVGTMPVCNKGTIAFMTSSDPDTACDGNGSNIPVNDSNCHMFGGGVSVADHGKAPVIAPSGGTCTASTTTTPGAVTTTAGRVCAPPDECKEQLCGPDGGVGGGYATCIAQGGIQSSCPTGWGTPVVVGTSATLSCSNDCTCDVNGASTCSGAKLSVFTDTGCGTPDTDITIDGNCNANPKGGDIVKSWKYTANLNQQCSTAGSKAATTGLNGPQTICCRP